MYGSLARHQPRAGACRPYYYGLHFYRLTLIAISRVDRREAYVHVRNNRSKRSPTVSYRPVRQDRDRPVRRRDGDRSRSIHPGRQIERSHHMGHHDHSGSSQDRQRAPAAGAWRPDLCGRPLLKLWKLWRRTLVRPIPFSQGCAGATHSPKLQRRRQPAMGAYCLTLHVRRRLPAQLFCQYPQIFYPPATEQPGEFVESMVDCG